MTGQEWKVQFELLWKNARVAGFVVFAAGFLIGGTLAGLA